MSISTGSRHGVESCLSTHIHLEPEENSLENIGKGLNCKIPLCLRNSSKSCTTHFAKRHSQKKTQSCIKKNSLF